MNMDRDPTEARCFIALGGNQGDVVRTFRSALNDLAVHAEIRVGRISTNHKTSAVGTDAGSGFSNAAAELFTTLSPHELLAHLQTVEANHGRRRTIRWGPRTLDLDLILFGQEVVDSPDLQIPHPACWYRRFVLDPLAEIAADVVHPVQRVSFAALQTRLLSRPLPVGLCGGDAKSRSRLGIELAQEFSQVAVNTDWSAGDPVPGLLFVLSDEGKTSDVDRPVSLPRVDVPAASDRSRFLREVLQSALGE